MQNLNSLIETINRTAQKIYLRNHKKFLKLQHAEYWPQVKQDSAGQKALAQLQQKLAAKVTLKNLWSYIYGMVAI